MKDTPTLMKRSYADALVNGKELVTKMDEINITDNRVRRNKNKIKKEKKKDGNLAKINLKKIYS